MTKTSREIELVKLGNKNYYVVRNAINVSKRGDNVLHDENGFFSFKQKLHMYLYNANMSGLIPSRLLGLVFSGGSS